MTRFVTAACIMIATCTLGLAHAANMVALEDAIETASDSIMLPSDDTGTLLRRGCNECDAKPLQLTRSSRYFIGNQAVTFEALAAMLKKSKRPHSLVIFHRFSDHTVTRFVVAD